MRNNMIATFRIILLLLGVVSIFVVKTSFAKTYYVSNSGSDHYVGTIDYPLRTIQKAASLVEAGDVVIVRAGIYKNSRDSNSMVKINKQGTKEKWITFKSEVPGGAVLEGGEGVKYGFLLLDKSKYIVIDGFNIHGMENGAIWGYKANNVVVKNNIIHHNGNYMAECSSGGGRNGVYLNPYTQYFVFSNNLIHDNGRIRNKGCDLLPGAKNHNYRHDHGLYLQGKNHLIVGNVLYGNHAGYDIKVDGHYGNYTGTYTHVIVNNTFGKNLRTDKKSGGVIRFFNNETINEKGVKMKHPVPYIKNNLFYKPGGKQADTAIRISKRNRSNFTGTVIANNMTTSTYMYTENLGTVIKKNVASSDNATNIDLRLINPDYNNYELSPSSPVINKSNPVDITLSDYNYSLQPRFNIGAIE